MCGAKKLVDGDRLAAEGLGAIFYMAVGKPVVTGSGKAAYWVNQQGGDIVVNTQEQSNQC